MQIPPSGTSRLGGRGKPGLRGQRALRVKRPGDKRYPFGIPEAALAAGLAGQWVWQGDCPINKLSFTQKPSSLSLLPLRRAPLVP